MNIFPSADAVFCWDLPRERLSERAPKISFGFTYTALGNNHWMPLQDLPKKDHFDKQSGRTR
ncbi:MAG: hypothetical protein CM1200mP41_37920 [Gammaproteobacteria bacterium]|nr:MAG: hypothetical protein CM1200mP41_37920 [Gammaproteobacteria bacterium]